MKIHEKLKHDVVDSGTCMGCGACIVLDTARVASMVQTAEGPVPQFKEETILPDDVFDICPGSGINYPKLYRDHFGSLPENWLLGNVVKARTGYASDPAVRGKGASGGVLTQVLIHLLESRRVDAIAAVRQGVPTPREARVVLAQSKEEILQCAQSVYIPVSVLDILQSFEPNKRYAMICLPDQAAALRRLQCDGHSAAQQVKYVLGPYVGTQLMPAAIDCFMRAHGIAAEDDIIRLEWRAGDWPGYLEIETESGRILRSKKVYYNFLIPFFATRGCRQTMDFSNEFSDLSVGDAWSPEFEAEGGGHSVLLTRSKEMEQIIQSMCDSGMLTTTEIDPLKAGDMHGHMLDFKKRGSYIRNQWRHRRGKAAPDFGLKPNSITLSRQLTERVISMIFVLAGSRFARACVAHIPEKILGPLFNGLRLTWKRASRPTKRKGLAGLQMIVEDES